MIAILLILAISFPYIQTDTHTDNYHSRSPYQVLIYTKNDVGNPMENIGLGSILQNRVILTTASSLFEKSITSGEKNLRKLENLAVIVRSSGDSDSDLIFSISNIIIHQKFDILSMEHDIALLNLSSALPLAQRDDLKWIVLADTVLDTKNCLEEYKELKMLNTGSDISIYKCKIYGTKNCTDFQSPGIANDQIGKYIIHVHGCNIEEWMIASELEKDVGLGLQCNSNLLAILSVVTEEPVQDNQQELCSNFYIKLHYTSILPYLSWIFEIVANEEMIDMQYKNYTTSLPYQEIKSGAIVNTLEPEREPESKTESKTEREPELENPYIDAEPLESAAIKTKTSNIFYIITLICIHKYLGDK